VGVATLIEPPIFARERDLVEGLLSHFVRIVNMKVMWGNTEEMMTSQSRRVKSVSDDIIAQDSFPARHLTPL
jgi:hypothetical protein